MPVRPFAHVAGLSPRRRALLALAALIVAAAAAAGGAGLAASGTSQPARATPSRPGHVLLVPGYGGSTSALAQLAARIRATGRSATVVHLPSDGTGDLTAQARVLDGYVNHAIRDGSGPVTVIGYSAGGVAAWLWDVDYRAAARVRMFITLGSPLHGADLAALGEALAPGFCPVACQQLAPGSSLLTALRRSPASARPPWLSLWTTDDQVVQPPDSARLAGAVNVPLQSVCPGAQVSHEGLPTSPLVTGIILRELAAPSPTRPAAAQCQSLESLGSAGS